MSLPQQAGKEFVPFGDRPGGYWEHPNMRRSDLVQHKEKENGRIDRTSHIVFGERQHLLRVLDSLEGTSLPIARMQQEADFPCASTVIKIDGLRVEYPDWFGLARASNTTPVVVLRFEGDTDAALERIKSEFRSNLARSLGQSSVDW